MQSIYDKIESRPERYELNLYIAGEDEDEPTAESFDDPVAAGVTHEVGGSEAPPAGAEPTDSEPGANGPQEG